jgi:uncharacterized phage protein (TIGR01671 family)
MAREIKFRAWGNTSHDMIGWDGIRPNLNLAFEQAKRDAIVLMQFTGLKDKNGKEIYEGDILIDIEENHTHPHLAKWQDDDACFAMETDDGSEYKSLGAFIGWKPEGAEVIGNIYENPDLLKTT